MHTNRLINETSPYLLQHAHNPVDWRPWSKEAFEDAEKENKLVLISIGYSSCHWCHVMEKQSFENEAIARLMNRYFICIKVDREERPDIDQTYMLAVQLMNGQGGWPLNCFALPDGSPVYGGTYFNPQQWMQVLNHLANLYRTDRKRVLEYGKQLKDGITQAELFTSPAGNESLSAEQIESAITKWCNSFDLAEGGMNRAPKFPMPNNYAFLMRSEQQNISDFVLLTLRKMAMGGIYDHIGKGFARYSTDHLWKVPHFEKMLYDNAQLLELYADAWLKYKDPLLKDTAEGIIRFLLREMRSEKGAFYSALDADSEGEEGKYYIWTKEELHKALEEDFLLFSEYFNVNEDGFWEHDNYIPLLKQDADEFSSGKNLDPSEFRQKIASWKDALYKIRSGRPRPLLDDKIICSWNALAISAFCKASSALDKPELLDTAILTGQFIWEKMQEDGRLYHTWKGRAQKNSFLEDYAFTINAYLHLFGNTNNIEWLQRAEILTERAIKDFWNEEAKMFYFRMNDQDLFNRGFETTDNVIPASCSAMAQALLDLSLINGKIQYEQMATDMLMRIQHHIIEYPSAYSNWGMLAWKLAKGSPVLVITGTKAKENLHQINRIYLPHLLVLAADKPQEDVDVFKNRVDPEKNLFYLCKNHSCERPVEDMEEIISAFI